MNKWFMNYIFINKKSIIQGANYAMFQNFLGDIFEIFFFNYFHKIHDLWNTLYYQTDSLENAYQQPKYLWRCPDMSNRGHIML